MMPTTHPSGVALGALLLALLPPSAGTRAERAPPTPDSRLLVVVVGRDSTLQTLSLDQLRRLYLGESVRDPSGVRLVPLNSMPGSPERVSFDRAALGMSPEEIGRYWIDRKIRGEGAAPRAFPSVALIQKLVAKVPGAVGYVRADRLEPGVRAVRIDGRDRGDPGYPLVMHPEAGP